MGAKRDGATSPEEEASTKITDRRTLGRLRQKLK
jgi:hypothetical protein